MTDDTDDLGVAVRRFVRLRRVDGETNLFGVAGCRPVEWTKRFQIPGTEPTPVYPGSIVAACPVCGIAIWVGPKAQESDYDKLCFICASLVTYILNGGEETEVRNMGNTWERRRD